MEPATGWGVHGGQCVDTLCSVGVENRRITENYDCVNWKTGHPLSICVVKNTYI